MAGRSPTSRKPGVNGAKTVTSTQSLSEFQAAFQSAVMDGDDSILELIPPNSRTGNGVLLGVYRYAYWGRLADIVASDYEILYSYMGDDQFASLAKAYTAACPSHTRNARWFSHKLPEFMAAT